jgi:hypothetical protein
MAFIGYSPKQILDQAIELSGKQSNFGSLNKEKLLANYVLKNFEDLGLTSYKYEFFFYTDKMFDYCITLESTGDFLNIMENIDKKFTSCRPMGFSKINVYIRENPHVDSVNIIKRAWLRCYYSPETKIGKRRLEKI